MELLNFQNKFIRAAFNDPAFYLSTLSIPRGNGKSTLCGHLIARCLMPGDPFFIGENFEVVLLAGSLEQARFVFRKARIELEKQDGEYRFLDSVSRLGITHKERNARLRVISSDSKRAFGLVGVKWVIGDEPGAWQTIGGQRMYDAIVTSAGKPDSLLRCILIGTIAPADEGGWWANLVDNGTDRKRGVYVQSLKGNRDRWNKASEIRRCNPLMWRYAESRKQLLNERDAAVSDPAAKTRFLRYRLNVPEREESKTLILFEDWEQVLKRPEAERKGKPIVGIDLGAGRSWSAAVAIWAETGRVEAIAFCPGIPSIEDQEKRDRIPRGTYQRLVDAGYLFVADNLRVQPIKDFVSILLERWGDPAVMIADRFRHEELKDACNTAGYYGEVKGRVTRWSESSEDIRAFRRFALDENMSVEKKSRKLITTSLIGAEIKNDDAGNSRLAKKGTNSTGRDDVVAAMLLACGEAARNTDTGISMIVPGG